MTVLELAQWKASMDPGPIGWYWPKWTGRRIQNGRWI